MNIYRSQELTINKNFILILSKQYFYFNSCWRCS